MALFTSRMRLSVLVWAESKAEYRHNWNAMKKYFFLMTLRIVLALLPGCYRRLSVNACNLGFNLRGFRLVVADKYKTTE
jgi:hypothetical protein